MIKLIATDLDGTLFYPKKKIKLLIKKNIKFLKNYIESGNRVILVSGRNFHIVERIKRKLKNNVDMLACNGSALYKDGEVIEDSPMSHDDVKRLYDDNLENKNIISWIYMTDKHNMILVPNKMNWFLTICYRIGMLFQFGYRGSYLFGKKHFFKMLDNHEVKIYKAMCIFGLGEKGIKKAALEYPKLLEKYGNVFEMYQSHESIELMNKGVNKATSLLKYIDRINLDIDEVAVVGDSGNDVPLFQVFPNSFVMEQAHDDVKSHAKTEIIGVYALHKYIGK